MHYLDNAATTRPSEAAVAALMRSATVCYGNPSSLHAHPAVLETLRAVAQRGDFTLHLLSTAGGAPSLDEAAALIDNDTALVAMMLVNNETGAIFPVREVGALVQKTRARFHVDAVQAFGKLPFASEGLLCHSLAVSAHKIGGVKGVGALWLAKGLSPSPVIYGGGQEHGLRSGTEPMPAIAAFGAAAGEYAARYAAAGIPALREAAVKGLLELGCVINQPPVVCPSILNFSVPGLRAEPMLHLLSERGVYLSSGSACSRDSTAAALKASCCPTCAIACAGWAASPARFCSRPSRSPALSRTRPKPCSWAPPP